MIRNSLRLSLAKRLTTVVAGGSLVLVGLLGSVHPVRAAALTSTNVEPATLIAGSTNVVTVTFTTTTSIPVDGKIKVTFPVGFDVSAAASGTCSTMSGATFATTVSSQQVILTRQGDGSIETAGVETCTISGIVNPTIAGSIGNYAIQTTNSGDGELDVDASVSGDIFIAAPLSSTNVQPASTIVSTTNTVTVTFTTANLIESDGVISVGFPTGFNVTGANGAACTSMDGTFTTSVSGQNVLIQRVGDGTSEPVGAQTCTINNVVNPSVAGTTATYTITTMDNGLNTHDTDSAVTGDIMVRSSAPVETTPLTYALAVSSPEAAEAFSAGESVDVQWSNTGTGVAAFVNLSYSLDGGVTWTSIAANVQNTGSYEWSAPSVSAQSVMVRVEGTDLVTTLATADSGAFSIGMAADDVADDTADDTVTDDTSSDAVTLLPEGTYMKGKSWSTVYAIGADGTRRPFLDSQTFFTYADNFDGVVEVEDGYLSNFMIGAPMLPKAGTVLVKIQSVNSVYVLEANNTLRWIVSEDVAEALYGSNWADFVIDVPVTAWGHFEFGEDVNDDSDVEVDESTMKTRNELNS